MALPDSHGESSPEHRSDTHKPGLTGFHPPNGVLDTFRTKYETALNAHIVEAGGLRYSDVKQRARVPSDANMSRRLEQLSDEALISQHHYDEIPPRVEYSLTPAGRELEEHLGGLLTWSESVDAG